MEGKNYVRIHEIQTDIIFNPVDSKLGAYV